MKYLATILVLAFVIACAPQQHNSFVTDNEHLFTADQITSLDKLYYSHERKTSNEIALCTISSYYPEENIQLYGTKLGKKMGVGKSGKNNGILIVICPPTHSVAICTGKGTEKVLKDEIATKIIDSFMIPSFKKGAYYEGIYSGSQAIITFLEKPGNEIK